MTSSRTQSSRRLHWFPGSIGMFGGVFSLASGVWAMVGPESFFDTAAAFEPYNQHFILDIGAFQIGLGAVLLLAGSFELAGALAVGLFGVGVGSVAHTISHIVGHDFGGNPVFDIPLFAVLSVLLLAGGLVRWRQQRAGP